VQAAQKFTNEADFLKSLDMVSVVEGFTPFNTPRVAQLSQRSNQFNLRTVRYTDGEIVALGASDKHVCLSFTLEDKFGDNGLICVIIMEKQDAKTLFVDTWLMSCRVLKRGMENFTLNTMVEYAKAYGFERIVGEYIPTLKNGMVKEHYLNLGFAPLAENCWALTVESYLPRECYIVKKSEC
jgi:FkbH-like protein